LDPDRLTAFDFDVNAWEPFAVIESSEQTIIDQVADRLTRKYPSIPPDTLTAVVRDAHARFDGRPVREFVPLLVERFAAKELDRLSVAGRPPVSTHGDSGTDLVESDSVC
jgi:hypothetical protein